MTSRTFENTSIGFAFKNWSGNMFIILYLCWKMGGNEISSNLPIASIVRGFGGMAHDASATFDNLIFEPNNRSKASFVI